MTQANPAPLTTPEQQRRLEAGEWKLGTRRWDAGGFCVYEQWTWRSPDSGTWLELHSTDEPPYGDGDPREIAKAGAILWPTDEQKRIAQLEGLLREARPMMVSVSNAERAVRDAINGLVKRLDEPTAPQQQTGMVTVPIADLTTLVHAAMGDEEALLECPDAAERLGQILDGAKLEPQAVSVVVEVAQKALPLIRGLAEGVRLEVEYLTQLAEDCKDIRVQMPKDQAERLRTLQCEKAILDALTAALAGKGDA